MSDDKPFDLQSEIADIKVSIGKLDVISQETRSDVKDLRAEINGRFSKIERTMFGDEPSGFIGVAERLRYLEFGWKRIVGMGVFAAALGLELVKIGAISMYQHFFSH